MINQYVKIVHKNSKVWLKVKTNSKGVPTINNKSLTGLILNSNKTVNFCPCDVLAFYEGSLSEIKGLGMAYIPTADMCNILDTVVPDSIGYEIHIALRITQEIIGKPLNKYVAEKLKYTDMQLCKALSAEQVDAIALAIFNIETKGQGMIIGDQTGIGKGRVAASMIRYAHLNGYSPIFLSEKPNLFTDLYRDLKDIGSENLRPFIVNSKSTKTDIKDKDGEIVHSAPAQTEQDRIFKTQKFPTGYDFVCATYSQFSQPEKKFVKPNFLSAVASQKGLLVMDESHNASGSSNTGEFLQAVISQTAGVVFLSATFAKRPDNMPVYANKTAISDANMTSEELIEAIKEGGVALQEIIASQLVSEGQMIRRERSFEGVEVNYITLTEKENEHKAIYDNITAILRDIIKFQKDFISTEIEEMDDIASAEGMEMETTKGTEKGGIDNQPFFSKVFQVVNQLLFSIKAKDVANKAIERLHEGKKPIIAFSSTMESFFEKMQHPDGRPVVPGDTINLDYSAVLSAGLKGVMKYTEIAPNGDREVKYLDINVLGEDAKNEYLRIMEKINTISTGISISPIDIIKDTIRNAGFTCDEVTGRKYEVQLIPKKGNYGLLQKRKTVLANDAFRMFNDNDLDCLLINQSGSTGASAHAIVTDKVPKEQVKQRVMIVLQPELNINTEVQKRGRVNRTGQILKPIYDYISSSIPAETRLMMMLQKKLKSLDANTTSNQKQSKKVLLTEDFLNKYGDKVVTDYLYNNKELSDALDDPLNFGGEEGKTDIKAESNAASKVSGRVAVLSTDEQEKFYREILELYNDYITYLQQTGEYDLEIEALNFESETTKMSTVIAGRSGNSVFSQDTYLETLEVNNLKKPFTASELENLIKKNIGESTAQEIQSEAIKEAKEFYLKRVSLETEEQEKKYDNLISKITSEKKYEKLKTEKERLQYINEREDELNKARKGSIEKLETKYNNIYLSVTKFLNFYYPGKVLFYPSFFETSYKAVCIGYGIDKNKSNPFALSSIKIKIAIASSDKYIELTLSGEPGTKLLAIMGNSQGINVSDDSVIQNWDYDCRKANTPRKTVYVVTGNILQGFSKYSGKLISFTTKDGSARKGILMPDNFDPVKQAKNFVTVPINTALDYISTEMRTDSEVRSNNGKVVLRKLYNFHNGRDFSLMVPANRLFFHISKDKEIIKLCNNPRDGFELKSGKMLAYFSKENLPKLIKYLGEKLGISIQISPSVFETYFAQKEQIINVKSNIQKKAEKIYEEDKRNFENRKKNIKTFSVPENISDDKQKRIRIAKVKAMAKLKLLKLTA